VVDLKRPDGRAAIHCLVRAADIVLENCGPGTMKRLGCGYDQLAALSLRLMYHGDLVAFCNELRAKSVTFPVELKRRVGGACCAMSPPRRSQHRVDASLIVHRFNAA
jgi:hypothetical protein